MLVTGTREHFYHGTSTKLAGPILSEGFVPDPRRRVWDQEAKQLASYSGTYLTRDLKIAADAADQAMAKFGGSRCIFEVQVETRTGLMDEDELPDMAASLDWIGGGRYHKAKPQEAAAHWIQKLNEALLDGAGSPQLLQHLRKPAEQWAIAIQQAVGERYIDPEDFYRFEPTAAMQAAKDKVVRTVGNIAKLSDGKNVRVLTPIRFKGANRILAAIALPHPSTAFMKRLRERKDVNSVICQIFKRPSAKMRTDMGTLWGNLPMMSCSLSKIDAAISGSLKPKPNGKKALIAAMLRAGRTDLANVMSGRPRTATAT